MKQEHGCNGATPGNEEAHLRGIQMLKVKYSAKVTRAYYSSLENTMVFFHSCRQWGKNPCQSLTKHKENKSTHNMSSHSNIFSLVPKSTATRIMEKVSQYPGRTNACYFVKQVPEVCVGLRSSGKTNAGRSACAESSTVYYRCERGMQQVGTVPDKQPHNFK